MPTDVVTGAFGYTGRYITRRLLAAGRSVTTLTSRGPEENPFGPAVRAAPYAFDRPDQLTAALAGAEVLYNTYWIRFPHGGRTFEQAIENTRTLLRCAREAGVRRIVHLSITRPDERSPWPYFRGKAIVERAIRESGLSYAILRPTVIFGVEDIQINNIAWTLRRFPVVPVPGRGDGRLQPIYVEDLADLAVAAGRRGDDEVFDAVGPEVFTYDQLVRLLAEAVGSRARVVRVPPWLALAGAWAVGRAVGDVLLTRDELAALLADRLVSDAAPTGATRLSDWVTRHGALLGAAYHHELRRHWRTT